MRIRCGAGIRPCDEHTFSPIDGNREAFRALGEVYDVHSTYALKNLDALWTCCAGDLEENAWFWQNNLQRE